MPKRRHLDIHTKEAARTVLNQLLETYNIATIGAYDGVTREAEAFKAHADRKAILQLAHVLLVVSEQGLGAIADTYEVDPYTAPVAVK